MLLVGEYMDINLINDFINCLKRLNSKSKDIFLPLKGQYKKIKAHSTNYSFIIDINLKGRLGHITLQLRNSNHQDKPILRLDITGPAHKNPEGDFEGAGKIIPCPHMHIADPLYGDSIAYPLDHENVKMYLTNDELSDLVIILRQFLNYINTANINDFNFYWQNQMNL